MYLKNIYSKNESVGSTFITGDPELRGFTQDVTNPGLILSSV